jgi:CBS domain-containing protein
VLAGGIGLLYAKSFYGVVRLAEHLPFSRTLRPASGALFVGLLALWLPEVLGTGYGWVQKGLASQMAHVPLYIILLLPLARIAATALSIGTGGSGGVFGPGMVIGAFTGLAVWRVLEPFATGVGHDPTAFIVVGMMAVFGGVSRAPLAVMIMVGEMTGSITLLAPAMVAVAISTFIVSRNDDSIYRSQLPSRAASTGARLQQSMPLLGRTTVASAAQPARVLLVPTMPVPGAIETLQRARVKGAPVVDTNGIYLGTASLADLVALATEAAPDKAPATVERVVDATAPTVASSATLDVGVDALAHAGGQWVTVTGQSRQVAGVLAASDVVGAYRRALRQSFGQLSQVSGNAVTIEARVGPTSPVVGVPLRQAHLPPGCIVVAVQRGDQLMFATASTTLAPGDVVSVLTGPDEADEVTSRMSGPGAPNGAGAGAGSNRSSPVPGRETR